MTDDQHDRHMTAESLQGLRDEIARLKTEERPKIAKAIGTAAQEGDLSENAEYHAAREEQGHLEAKITRLEDKERSAIVITEQPKGDAVNFGSTVSFKDSKVSGVQVFRIVASHEADATNGRLSSSSPVAMALQGHKKGDVVTVRTPSGPRELTITKVA